MAVTADNAMDGVNLLKPGKTPHQNLRFLLFLAASGLTLVFGILGVINLAHGSLFALGMYFALFFVAPSLGWFPALQAWYMGLSIEVRYLVALILAPVFVGIFGMLLELCLRRTYGRDPLYGLLLTFGAALVLSAAMVGVQLWLFMWAPMAGRALPGSLG